MNTPKFKKGDWIKSIHSGRTARIVMLLKTCYSLQLSDGDSYCLDYSYQDNWELIDAPHKNKLEGAAGLYADNEIPTDYPDYFCRQDIKDAFIAGAKWMESQMPMPEDTVIFMKGVEEGRRLEREDRNDDKLPRYYGD